MASYINGITDFIPSLVPFQPDFNYYANVLATKQQQFDTGLAKINSIYGSVLNSPMLRQDNIERRGNYFNTIQQDIQKVAGMDLSLDQNVNTAKTLFDPILNDKHIVNDMIFSKRLQNSYGTAESFRNCVDPNKCNGEFWNEGVQALNYAAEEFKNANPDDALNLQAPKFTPYQNVTKKAMEAAKASGFNVSYDSVQGGYIVTDTNGQMLLGKDGKGILPQYLYGMFGNDPKVQEMYTTQAYVERKNFAKSFSLQNGVTEDQAESYYLNSVLQKIVPQLENSKKELTSIRDKANIDADALSILAKNNGGVIEGDGIEPAYTRLQQLIEKTNDSEKYHEGVSNLIANAPKLNDIRALRNRVDNIVANGHFMNTIDQASYDYAIGTSKREIKADPYALAAYNNSLDFNKAINLKKLDNQIWKEQQTLLGNIGVGNFNNKIFNALNAKGLGWDDLYKMGITEQNINDKTSISKLAQAGLLTQQQASSSNNFLPTSGKSFINTYIDNAKVTAEATDVAIANSTAYVKDVISSFQQEYKKAINNPDQKEGIGIRAKILADAKNILQGTGINYQDAVLGNISLEDLDKKDLSRAANTAALFQGIDPSSRVYNNGWDGKSIMKMQIANQAAQGLIQERTNIQKNAIKNLTAKYIDDLKNGDMTQAQYIKAISLLKSSYNEDGTLLTQNEAFSKYAKAIGGYNYNMVKENTDKGGVGNPGRYSTTGSILTTPNDDLKGSMLLTKSEFEKNYPTIQKSFDDMLVSLRSKPGSKDAGGGIGTEKAVNLNVDGDQPLSSNYLNLKNIFTDLKKDPENFGFTVASYAGKGGELEPNNIKSNVVNRLMDMVLSGDTKNATINTTIQYLPKENGSNIAMKITVDDKTARSLNDLKEHDPVTDAEKTFIIEAPAKFNSLQGFVKELTPSPADILLRTNGKSISINFPNKGTSTIRNNNGQLYMDNTVSMFDPQTGTISYVKQPTEILQNPDPNKKGQAYSMDEISEVVKSIFDTANMINEQAKADYLKSVVNARSKSK